MICTWKIPSSIQNDQITWVKAFSDKTEHKNKGIVIYLWSDGMHEGTRELYLCARILIGVVTKCTFMIFSITTNLQIYEIWKDINVRPCYFWVHEYSKFTINRTIYMCRFETLEKEVQPWFLCNMNEVCSIF